ncbi:unnamed protein product [Toxocara canis]|uniref:Uncharacterized protein n=1 Tax=Toxocara canis TaxID=6265 RepID=A0A183VH01_TOXCA|nr:unnamed protein product [Toxocara canis]
MRKAGCRIKLPSKVDDVDDIMDTIAEGNDAIVERLGILMDTLSRNARCEEVTVPQLEPGAEYVSGISGQRSSQGRYAVLLSRANHGNESTSSNSIPHRTTEHASSGILMDTLSRNARCEEVIVPQLEPGAEYVSGISGQRSSQGRYAVLLSRANHGNESTSSNNIPHRTTEHASSVCRSRFPSNFCG